VTGIGSALAFTATMLLGAVTGVIADRVWQRTTDWWTGRAEAALDRFRRARADANTFSMVTEALKRPYESMGHNLLSLKSGLYPCVVFRAHQDDPDVLLSPLVATESTSFGSCFSDESYRKVIERTLSRPLFDGGVYPLVDLDPDGPLMSCRYSEQGYFDVLDTCVSLEYEAFLAAARSRSGVLKWDRLKLRQTLHAAVPDPVLSGGGRVSGIGGSTVLVYWDGTDYRTVVPQRSRAGVAASQGLFAVVPTFMVQALHGSAHTEYSISYNVKREFCEELQDLHLSDTVDPQTVKQSECFQRLEGMLSDPARATHLALGVAVNLLELRADACTLLLIHDKTWVQSLRLSDEFSTHRQFLNTPRVHELLASLDTAGLPYAPHEIVPACAGALWMALRTLQDRPELLIMDGAAHV
jgi:hypothetical protein